MFTESAAAPQLGCTAARRAGTGEALTGRRSQRRQGAAHNTPSTVWRQ
uniref:Uncharacterized protein n=1 Tax=Arundo donax TaxID=35708 RepID=A0A0A8YRM5_ARUDO